MLADLKQILIAYNDYPFNYIMKNVDEFSGSDEQIMFAHIRESDEIEKVVKACAEKGVNVLTLLVKRNDKFFVKKTYGNAADDGVENYPYDLIYSGNNDTVEFLEKDFNAFFDKLAGTNELKEQIKAHLGEEEIRKTWSKGLDEYKKIREKYVVYKRN